MRSRWGIALTYRCNLACPECNRFLDRKPLLRSDITLEGLQEGYDRVMAAGIQIDKTRVTGGEPLLHPLFVEAVRVIKRTWNKNYGGRTCVFTNGTRYMPKPDRNSWRYRTSDDSNRTGFRPTLLSPADLGLEPVKGLEGNRCSIQKGCGRLYDVFGFSFCVLAGGIGRLFGVDVYDPDPVMWGTPEVCRHCIWSQPRKTTWSLIETVRKNEVEYPSRSYKEALGI